MTPREAEAIIAFVNGPHDVWEDQPSARVVNAGFETNPSAECVEVTVVVRVLGGRLYGVESTKVFSMAGARVALGY